MAENGKEAQNVTLTDAFVLDGVRRTSDGYLAAHARVARTGIQMYKGRELGKPEIDNVAVYRPPSEVFAPDAMHSMAHRPVTLHHPNVPVTAKNWKQYAKGHTGDEVVRDGDSVRVPMVLMDADTIQSVLDGTRELSMGYSTDLKWEPGVTSDGQKYDAIQTQIRANHLAVVPVARGGSSLRLGDGMKCEDCGAQYSGDECPECDAKTRPPVKDGSPDQPRDDRGRWSADLHAKQADFHNMEAKNLSKQGGHDDLVKMHSEAERANRDAAYQINHYPTEEMTLKTSRKAQKLTAKVYRADNTHDSDPADADKSGTTADSGKAKGRSRMAKIVTIDGAPVEISDELGAAVVSNHIAKLVTQVADANTKVTEAVTIADGFKKTLETQAGEIAVLKKQLADATITPDKLDVLVKERTAVIDAASTVLNGFSYEGKSIEDIRRAAVAVKLGDAAAKDMSDGAVEGAFKMLTVDAKPASGVQQLGRAIYDHQAMGGNRSADPRQAALIERNKTLTDAWRGGNKQQ